VCVLSQSAECSRAEAGPCWTARNPVDTGVWLTKSRADIRIQCLCIDTNDPAKTAQFWQAALGWRRTFDEEDQIVLEPPEGSPEDGIVPDLLFLRVPETKAVKNRLHLDVHASGGRAVPIESRRQRVDAEARRLSDLGATMAGILTEEGIDHYAVAMKDPEGNEFDIN